MKEIVVGILGAGRIARVHTESITTGIPGARIKSVADPFATEETEKWAEEKGIEILTKDPSVVINDPEIEAILICSSTSTHAQFTREAALAGKHIFCEKPLDLDVERIRETMKIVEEAGVKFQIGFNRRFDHNFMALRQAVEEGKIGEPHIIRITSRDPEPPNPQYIAGSGGIFMDMTIHDFDMIRYLSGSEVEEVYCKAAVLVDPAIGEAGDVDTAVITLTMANGALGIIENSRKAAYGYDQRAEVFGSKGAIKSSNDSTSTAVLSTVDGVVSEKPLFFFLERYLASFTHEMKLFFNYIREGGKSPAGPDCALKPVQIALAVKESVRTGLPVKVE
ncbi:MAG: inositol 2-dehydrogenase [Spirochaetales bacterium]|nr:inositol 2-dehydrogenase [Spirochaetales bacterium]